MDNIIKFHNNKKKPEFVCIGNGKSLPETFRKPDQFIAELCPVNTEKWLFWIKHLLLICILHVRMISLNFYCRSFWATSSWTSTATAASKSTPTTNNDSKLSSSVSSSTSPSTTNFDATARPSGKFIYVYVVLIFREIISLVHILAGVLFRNKRFAQALNEMVQNCHILYIRKPM